MCYRADVRSFSFAVLPLVASLLLVAQQASAEPPARVGTTPVDARALKHAITDLIDTFGARYPQGGEFLERLNVLEKKLEKSKDDADAKAELVALRREALVANPLVSGQPMLFVVRNQYRNDHHNTATMFQTGEINTRSFAGGGSLKAIDFKQDGEVTTLLDLPEGIVRDPEVRFDGKKVLFSMRRDREDDYHLYEMNIDGSDLTQLTTGKGLSDIDPIYVPSGKIVFSSTREPKYCQCNRHIMANLFTMTADGKQIEQIGHSTLHEGHAALLPDGRLIYDRWEYVDRNFGDAQGLWTTNPDGTNHAIYYGNATRSPGGVLDARHVPGTELMLTTFSSCHDRPWGALALIDQRRGVDGKEAVLRTWPASAINLVDKGNYDTFKRVSPKYEDPYPLSDKYFLCSRATGNREQVGIYLLDTFGNEMLLHQEGPGCFSAMPLGKRKTPPVLQSIVDHRKEEGSFYVENVYIGTGMDEIQRGSVKSLRVVEVPEKRFWTKQAWNGSGTQAPGMAFNDFNSKRIIGTAPVEADGSAFFSVPADTYVHFQLLDEKGMMVQSMRSGSIVRPGETSSCVGCHDQRQQTVVSSKATIAIQRKPSKLATWHGPTRKFSYTQEVQPVFDKHCTKCHDYGKPAGKVVNLAGDLGLAFNTSYYDLRSKNMVKVIGAGPANVMMPKAWGSHASRLAKVLVDGHQDKEIDKQINLDAEGFDRIITWIDINAPYYPDYACSYPENRYGRSPLNAEQLSRLGKLTGTNFGAQQLSAHISFTRPELSPCLLELQERDAKAYQQALEIIQAGAKQLAELPRADMPGFRFTGVDAEREAKYQARAKEQAESRREIIGGGE